MYGLGCGRRPERPRGLVHPIFPDKPAFVLAVARSPGLERSSWALPREPRVLSVGALAALWPDHCRLGVGPGSCTLGMPLLDQRYRAAV